MLLGLEQVALIPMVWGIGIILGVVDQASSMLGSQVHVRAAPAWLAFVFAGGLCWLCIWRSKWWPLGLGPIAATLVLVALQKSPDPLITGDAELAAVRLDNGRVGFSTLRRGSFTRDFWLAMMGQPEAVACPNSGGEDLSGALRCDSLGCLYRPPEAVGMVIAVEFGVAALADDCGKADSVVSVVPVRRDCSTTWGMIDRFDLWRYRTHAVTFTPEGPLIETVAQARGERPWHPSSIVSSQIKSVVAQEPNKPALHLDPIGAKNTSFIGGICRFQRDGVTPAPEPFQGRFLVVDQGNNDRAVLGVFTAFHDNRVTVENTCLHHGIALDLERVTILGADHRRGNVNTLGRIA